MPTLRSQPSRFIEWNSGIVAHIHAIVVNPRRPLAGYIRLGPGRPRRQHHEQEQKKPRGLPFPVDVCESHALTSQEIDSARFVGPTWRGIPPGIVRNLFEMRMREERLGEGFGIAKHP